MIPKLSTANRRHTQGTVQLATSPCKPWLCPLCCAGCQGKASGTVLRCSSYLWFPGVSSTELWSFWRFWYQCGYRANLYSLKMLKLVSTWQKSRQKRIFSLNIIHRSTLTGFKNWKVQSQFSFNLMEKKFGLLWKYGLCLNLLLLYAGYNNVRLKSVEIRNYYAPQSGGVCIFFRLLTKIFVSTEQDIIIF